MMRRTTIIKAQILAAVLTIAALMTGQSVAQATTKTVTYTITSVEQNLGSNQFFIVFTRSGDAPFDASAPTTYTVTVPNSSLGQTSGGSGGFSVELADGFKLELKWGSGSDVRFTNNYIRPWTSNRPITYTVSHQETFHYVTHVMMTGAESNFQHGMIQTYPNSGSIDTDYNSVWDFSEKYYSEASFGQITISYSDTPDLSVFESDGENAYKIKTKYDLRHLANYVNNGHNPCTGLTFRQTQDITCDNSYTPIGTESDQFSGTYDGQSHKISGITINRTGSNIYADGYMGLFGYVGFRTSTDYGIVRNVVLANSTFTGRIYVGGIVGYNSGGTVENCRVESTVTINAGTDYALIHGGIVGYNYGYYAKIIGCISAAVVSQNGKSNCADYGGIVGGNWGGIVKDCLYTGTTVTAAKEKGAIIGFDNGTYTNNYYTAINLGGVGEESSSNDQDGARCAHTVTLGENIALVGDETAYSLSGLTAIGTGNCALRYNDGTTTTLYSGEGQTLTLSYTGTVPTGYTVNYTVNGTAIEGDSFTMPAEDVTVNYNYVVNTYYVSFNANDGTSTISNQTFTYNVEQNLTANAFTRIGYTFSGWSTTPGGSVVYTDGQEVTNLTAENGATVNLYAQWTAHQYTLRLHHNDGTDDYTDMAMTYDVAADIQGVSRTGCTFDRWTTNADGTGDSYTDGQSISNLTATDGDIVELYAQWTPNTYTVTLDNQGATTAGTTEVTATYDAAMLAITVPTRRGYAFGGYYTETNGGGTKYYNADGTSANSWNIASTTTLYAYWTYDWEGDGTAEDPYQISSYAGLKEFANIVNGTYGEANPNACAKLLADIVCKNSSGDTEYATDWVPIGNDSHPYTGTFDGQGYSITALSTSTDNSSDYVGLFGYIGSGGVVKNVILANTTITGTNYVGVIAGFNGGTLTANYYLDCSVNSATTNIGTGSGDTDGARSVHSLTLGDNITASGESVDIGETTYYAAGATVTLSYSGEVPEGYRVYYTVKDASDNDVTVNKDNGEYTFIMPASNVTITATTKENLWETGSCTIATWEGNRKGAVTFTFDDGAPSQVSDAGPLFKKYGYKATFFLVYNWNPDWSGFQDLADEGHEIGSHSNSHVNNMNGEEASSKQNINGKINQPYGCITVAYPNGNVPSVSTVMQNYIAGRIFNGSWAGEPDIMGKDGPSNWAKCSALMTGSESMIKNTADFTGKMQAAVNSEGWVMFATHGFLGKNNSNATYSPTDLGAIEGALEWAQEHDDDIWVTTFRNGVMYVKERKASSFTLTDEEKNRLTFTLTHSIADDVCPYDYPLTLCITAEQDDGYDYVITQNGKVIDDVKTDGTTFMFQAIPNGGNIVVTRIPRMDLANNADNTSVINDHNGETVNVTLQGRTLYRDGAWNTLCLPFEVSIADGPLSGDGVKAMTLDTDNSGVSGSTLTLKFTEVSLSGEQGGLIPAGTPFIIKWEDNVSGSVTNPYNEGSVTNPDNGGNIEGPLFSSVIIDANASTDITSTDGKVTFTGSYDPVPFTANDRTKLYLGAQDKLYYPGKNMTLGAFRAYFQLKGISMSDISETRIFFEGEERPTITEVREVKEVKDDRWYDLQGRSLSPTLPSREGSPQGKGIYIVNGKKVIVK